MQVIKGVRVMEASEIGVTPWRSDDHARRIAPGGFVKAGFSSERPGKGTASETLWVHVGSVLPGGKVAGVLDSVPAFFTKPGGGVLVVLSASQIVSVLDTVTDWVPDLWESTAPTHRIGEGAEGMFQARGSC